MAISKGRLEELIKEGATIYYADRDVKFPIPIFLNEEDFIKEKELSHEGNCVRDNILLEDLYEEQKNAEWALKYHATRTEELDLPTWEEWCENILNDCETIVFNDTHYNKYGMFVDDKIDKNIIITKYLSEKHIVFKPNTQENYIKACDLCLKLFKGE